MPVLEPRALRALKRIGPAGARGLVALPKADMTYACFFWALGGFRALTVEPNPFYDYVNGFGNWGDLQGVRNVIGGRLNAEQVTLNGLRQRWTPYIDAVHTSAKTRNVTEISKEVTKCVIRINGLVPSGPRTDYEVCNHFPAAKPVPAPHVDRVVQGALVRRHRTPQEMANEERGRGPNFDHWWLRIVGRVTVETFPRSPNLHLIPEFEQNHVGLEISRTYVTGLHQEQVDQIMDLIEVKKGHLPFIRYGARQVWEPDTDRDTCNWCDKTFGIITRRHHCRRCGLLFCKDCSTQRDQVNHPANEANANIPAANNQRVCMTCYTQNN